MQLNWENVVEDMIIRYYCACSREENLDSTLRFYNNSIQIFNYYIEYINPFATDNTFIRDWRFETSTDIDYASNTEDSVF